MLHKDKCFMINMMFKSIHGLVPDYICDEITMQQDITVRTTRSNVPVPHIILEYVVKMHLGQAKR